MQPLSRLDDLESCPDDDGRAVIANDILEDVYQSKVSVEDVAKRLSSDSVDTRRAVAWILEESGRRCASAAKYVLMGMRDSDSAVRTNCAKCLGWLEGQWLVPAMATLIFHLGDDFYVSSAAADSILMQLKYRGSDILHNLGSIDQYLTDNLGLPVPESTCISAILRQEPTCGDASRGVSNDSQRLALVWAIMAIAAKPPLLAALTAGLQSKHESVAVLSAERLGREIEASCSNALKEALASQSKPVALALNHLAATMLQVGDDIQSTLKVDKNGEIGAFAGSGP
ncbi:MAG TPA: HEAT repeat domain-containing protein [Pirellulaceae bacterium]|nr:HEAT repeat domain-containing protein [Pirellulaceae bacterium]